MLNVDRRVLEERRSRVEAELKAHGYDALVIYALGSTLGSTSKSHGYMSFLADWDSYNTPGVLLLVPGQEPVLFVANIFLKCMTERDLSWGRDVRLAMGPALPKAVAAAIAEKCGTCRRIAYVGREDTPVPFWESLRASVPGAEFADFEAHIDPMRVVKDATQYALHYRGAEICDSMFQELHRQIKQNKPIYQLQNEMVKLAHDNGAEHALVWMSIAPVAEYCLFRRDECQRVPQYGDQVVVGIYMLYHGHWAHALRMGTYGAPTAAQQRAFDVVLEMENAGIAALKPGGNLYDVNRAFENVYCRHFSEKDDPTMFRFRAAHGLGHSYEDPISSAPFPQPYSANAGGPEGFVEFGYQRHAAVNNPAADKFMEIKPGMLFEFHPNFFQQGVAGAAIGDMVYVGENGAEIMTKFPRQSIRWDK